MIKKISQLNRLPEGFYNEDYFGEGAEREELLRKKNEILFEVSYETADTSNQISADEVNYYTSYSTTLSALKDIFGIEGIEEAITTILEGGLSVVSGDLSVGTPGVETNDRLTGHYYYPDSSHSLKIYSKTDLQNDLEIHGKTTIHNNVVLTCNDGSSVTDRDNPILLVNGTSKFNQTIYGTAYRARWGDLAEIYSADTKYEPGTLIKFGGDKEITVANDKANGVVTSNPAMVLNEENAENMEFPTGIALVGRVPIRIRGPVRKFDKIVLSRTDPGIGVVYNYAYPTDVIARTLEENQDPGEKLVMCVTKMNLI